MLKKPLNLALLIAGLGILSYFLLDIVSPELKEVDKGRQKLLEVTGLGNLEKDAIGKLDPAQKAELEGWHDKTGDSTQAAEALKTISGIWYRSGRMDISGAYAMKVAEMEKTAEAWGIAGTTFLAGIDEMKEEKSRLFCRQNAEVSLQNAISLAPAEPRFRLLLALVSVKMPGEDPMRGIRSLLDLEKEHPDYLPLQYTLTRLAFQTGQWEKAKARLDKVLAKAPLDREANCLMAELLGQGQVPGDPAAYEKICRSEGENK